MFFLGKALVLKNIWTPALFLVIIVGAFLVIILGKHPNPSFNLVIYDEQKAPLYQVAVLPGQEVILSYRHSADGTPVVQIFEVREDSDLYLLEEQYSWYGAGLEYGSGYDFTFEEDTVRVKGYDRKFSELLLRVARTVPQQLEVSGEIVRLSDLAPGGTRLLLKIDNN